MSYVITQRYLPSGRGDIPALTPAEADTRFTDPGEMQGTAVSAQCVVAVAINTVRFEYGSISSKFHLFV